MATSSATDTERRAAWIASPVVVAVCTAVVGLFGTAAGVVLQGYWNTQLERQKFEFGLIQKALEATDQNDAARKLQFLLDAGLIRQFDADRISKLVKQPENLPLFFGSTIRIPGISPRDVKAVLAHIGLYKGEINDQDDTPMRQAVMEFQRSKGMPADGMIGAMTAQRLREAWPDYFKDR